MNFNNMLNDLAPKLLNGYKGQLAEDPSLMQGKKFLNYETSIKNKTIPMLNLFGTNDASYKPSNSAIFNKEGKIVEGLAGSSDSVDNSRINQLQNEFNNLLSQYNTIMSNLSNNYGSVGTAQVNDNQRLDQLRRANDLANRMTIVSQNLINQITDYSSSGVNSTNQIKDQIASINRTMEMLNEQKNDYWRLSDNTSIYAEQESSHLLAKERYFRYILWGIVTIIIIYITIYVMVGSDSSSTTIFIMIAVILLFLLFLYKYYYYKLFMFDNPFGELKTIALDVPKIDFNPLVSIKYTN